MKWTDQHETGGEGDCFEQMVSLQSNCILRWGLQMLLTRKESSEREGPGAGQSGCHKGLTYQCVTTFSQLLLFWSFQGSLQSLHYFPIV